MTDERRYRVLATCSVFEPGFRGGGPIRSLARIIDTAPNNIDVALVTRDRDFGCSGPYPGLSGSWVRRGRSRVFYLDTGALRQWLRLWRDLRRTPFDLLYVNSLWEPVFSVLPIVAVRLGVINAKRVLLAPRGELSPGALALKVGKKRLFLKWWDPVLRSMDVVWHASTEREEADIKASCPWARVLVNQNQFSLPREPLPTAVAHEGPARLVFIGRISPKKNLDLVLKGLRLVSRPVHFDIYGPIEDAGYWAKCRSIMDELQSSVDATYRGELAPSDVRRTFGDYDAFVFPTLGENFGHVIAESLSASCPVICSDETPWTEVLEGGGGAVVRELKPHALAKEMERIAAMTPAERIRVKQLAGGAYLSWRTSVGECNVLDQARESEGSPGSRPGGRLSHQPVTPAARSEERNGLSA